MMQVFDSILLQKCQRSYYRYIEQYFNEIDLNVHFSSIVQISVQSRHGKVFYIFLRWRLSAWIN